MVISAMGRKLRWVVQESGEGGVRFYIGWSNRKGIVCVKPLVGRSYLCLESVMPSFIFAISLARNHDAGSGSTTVSWKPKPVPPMEPCVVPLVNNA